MIFAVVLAGGDGDLISATVEALRGNPAKTLTGTSFASADLIPSYNALTEEVVMSDWIALNPELI